MPGQAQRAALGSFFFSLSPKPAFVRAKGSAESRRGELAKKNGSKINVGKASKNHV